MTLLLVLMFGLGCAVAAGAWVYEASVEASKEWIADNWTRQPGADKE